MNSVVSENSFPRKQQSEKKLSSQSINAWLVEYASEHYIALSLQSCQEIIETPNVLTVPGLVHYGVGVLSWRDLWLPVIDLMSLTTGKPRKLSEAYHVLVVAYSTSTGEKGYVALALSIYPQIVRVTNESICALPQSKFDWPTFSLSCFRYKNSRVPIVDVSKLFSQAHT